MALIGSISKEIREFLYQEDSQTWNDNSESATTKLFANQGYLFPQADVWVNKPTGRKADNDVIVDNVHTSTLNGGMVMAFPRSAEKIVVPPQPSGDGGWKVMEA